MYIAELDAQPAGTAVCSMRAFTTRFQLRTLWLGPHSWVFKGLFKIQQFCLCHSVSPPPHTHIHTKIFTSTLRTHIHTQIHTRTHTRMWLCVHAGASVDVSLSMCVYGFMCARATLFGSKMRIMYWVASPKLCFNHLIEFICGVSSFVRACVCLKVSSLSRARALSLSLSLSLSISLSLSLSLSRARALSIPLSLYPSLALSFSLSRTHSFSHTLSLFVLALSLSLSALSLFLFLSLSLSFFLSHSLSISLSLSLSLSGAQQSSTTESPSVAAKWTCVVFS